MSKTDTFEGTATYSPEDNKIRIYPFARLDTDTYARVRAAGYIWAAKQDLFVAPMWTPEREDLALELAGAIDHEESTLEQRAEQRAERFDGYQDNRREDAETAHAAVKRIADGIPFGQPILVGHHSERHARRDAERIESGMRRAVNAWNTAEYWKRRAAGVKSHATYKARPDVRARRIKGLESDLRKVTKNLETTRARLGIWRTLHDDAETTIRRKAGSELPPLTFADRVRFILGSTETGSYRLYSDFTEGKIDAAGAQAQRIAECEAYLIRGERWREHYANRLTYERALLEESGYQPPPKRASKAELPLLNYPGVVAYRNPYNREIVRTEAIPITAAQWKAIHVDYKSTRISECGTHRVRTAMHVPGTPRGFQINAVYLTDSKTHDRPPVEAIAAKAAEERAALDRMLEASTERLEARHAAREAEAPARAAEAVAAEPYRQMAESLKAGVQTVSAPQLFPTPAGLADRLVALADIRTGHKVLEPSAGTGRILDALVKAEHWRGPTILHAVEVHPTLARGLHAKYSGLVTVFAPLDFLKLPTGPAGSYDRIVMNPPFAKGAALEHLDKARALLAPGGRLVCVLPGEASRYDDLDPVHVEDLPAGTFEESGTGVRACVVVIE